MSDTLIQIGTAKLYSEVTLAEVLDGHVLSDFDGLTLAEIFPVSSHKWLSGESCEMRHAHAPPHPEGWGLRAATKMKMKVIFLEIRNAHDPGGSNCHA